jgi:hypothetical protein
MRDLWLEHMENRCGCVEEEFDREELSNEESLERTKCELIGPSERVAQLVASAAASYYGLNLQEMLADSFYRTKFNMKARQW